MPDHAKKIFVIGLQRTGTTSMAAALNGLGFPCKDFPKELFDNVHHDILNRYVAFTDNPIPLIYANLARRFPDAHYILTTRNEDSWLKSVEWLFDQGKIRFGWEKNGTADSIHYAFYGRTTFDESVFREKFRQYHNEVRVFFHEQQIPLLEFDLTKGDGWAPLCDFLTVPIPTFEFPRLNDKGAIPMRRHLRHYWRCLLRPKDRFRTTNARHRIRPLDPRAKVQQSISV